MSEATKLFFIVGESTITSPYKYKKFRLPKKVQVKKKIDQVLILLADNSTPTARVWNTSVGWGLVGKMPNRRCFQSG